MSKKKFMFAALFLYSTFSYTQNLISNSSFEDTVQCPTVKGIISNASNWLNFGGTPDVSRR